MKAEYTFVKPSGQTGTYTHDANLTSFSTDRKVQMNYRTGQVAFETHTITMQIRLLATGQSAITSEIVDLESAYSYPGLQWRFLQDDGTPTPHVLLSVNMLGYITSDISYPNSLRNEYATQRGVQVALSARYIRGYGQVMQFQESIAYLGNGQARRQLVESVTGQPVKQTLCQYTGYRLVQSGQAIGTTTTPAAPNPVLGQPYYDGDQSSVEPFSGERHVFQQILPGIRWSYLFSSPTPFPTILPGA